MLGIGISKVKTAKHAPAAATAAVITLAAIEKQSYHIHKIIWSYDTTPTGGLLTVTVNGAEILPGIPITASGPGALSVNITSNDNEAVVITLASGAGTVVGRVYAEYENG